MFKGLSTFFSLIYDCFRVIWLFFLKERFEVPHVFKHFFYQEIIIKKKFAILISMLQFDNALEHNDHSLSSFCVKNRLVQ